MSDSSQVQGTYDRPHRCDLCSVGFTTEGKLKEHYDTRTHKKAKNRSNFRSKLGVPESDYYVYCIEISPVGSDQMYYYTGQTVRLLDRIEQHRTVGEPESSHRKRFPTENKTNTKKLRYEVHDVVCAEACSNADEALIRERELMLEMAQKHDTVDVIGGR